MWIPQKREHLNSKLPASSESGEQKSASKLSTQYLERTQGKGHQAIGSVGNNVIRNISCRSALHEC